MCLYLMCDDNSNFIKNSCDSSFIKRLSASKKGEITCWKVYSKFDKRLISFFFKSKIRCPGVVNSNRNYKDLTRTEKQSKIVNKGIHVYTDREEAQKNIAVGSVIVPVICRKSNLVAEGYYDEAVFTKVRIRSRTWNRIFKHVLVH